MPRNEGYLDPGAGPLASFAWDLRALREKSGKVPYRVLAKRAGFCASTLSVAASGARLPSLDVTLAYVQACGGDPEPWRARWSELAELHPPAPAHPEPVEQPQPGLQVAPPYDADELGELELDEPDEPARLKIPAAVAVASAVDDSSCAVAVLTHEVARSDEHELPLLETHPAATALIPPRDVPRWRSRLSIGRVATVALTLATAILSLKVAVPDSSSNAAVAAPPANSTSTPMQQADQLYAVIYQTTAMRSDASDAMWDLNSCRNLSNAQNKLRNIARQRQAQVEQLGSLDVAKVPNSVQLSTALTEAWLDSAQTATAYANIAADLQTGCTTGAYARDPNYKLADQCAAAAGAAKAQAAQLWNINAHKLGLLQISADEI
jgi:hypothetical protein